MCKLSIHWAPPNSKVFHHSDKMAENLVSWRKILIIIKQSLSEDVTLTDYKRMRMFFLFLLLWIYKTTRRGTATLGDIAMLWREMQLIAPITGVCLYSPQTSWRHWQVFQQVRNKTRKSERHTKEREGHERAMAFPWRVLSEALAECVKVQGVSGYCRQGPSASQKDAWQFFLYD